MKERYPSEMRDRFMVRLPDGMRDKISAAAKAANRTMNGEIVARLEASFAEDAERTGKALSAIQSSKTISMEKRMIGMRIELDNVQERLAKLQARIESTKGESPTKRRGK